MDFHEKVEHFINILQESSGTHYDEKALEGLEKLLKEYVRNYKQKACSKGKK